jgi:hypothetical protein
MKEQGMGCVRNFFWPNERAIGVGFETYVDIGSGSDVRSSLTRPEEIPDTSHTLLRHLGTAAAVTGKGI